MAMVETFTPRVPAVSAVRALGAAPTYDTAAMAELKAWVEEIRELTQPADVHWVDGSAAENDALLRGLVDEGKLIKLNPEWRPGSYLARSHPSDVARTEARTFIASEQEKDAGPTNNWADPSDMRAKMTEIFEGSMRGRTMYLSSLQGHSTSAAPGESGAPTEWTVLTHGAPSAIWRVTASPTRVMMPMDATA